MLNIAYICLLLMAAFAVFYNNINESIEGDAFNAIIMGIYLIPVITLMLAGFIIMAPYNLFRYIVDKKKGETI